ncbi:glycine betaine ABC transporter substrate-binding protein [Devosia aquimaris]|uniref:glycine betaine ABC transporter substrate-binding protein n=1 Tax=Devosia aquimaris TaxID=2866214 RepID=UPI001CD096FC|nr:glycine betaine ABC transporter substrate-binding protein [Devosia sp. CJK-A8-3]
MILKTGGLAAAMAVAFMATTATPTLAQDTADAASCGTDRTIEIAEMTWPSAAALAQIHAKILDAGFGCSVALVTGDTVPTTSSMVTRGSPAVAPELWTSTVQEQWDDAAAEGTVVDLGDAISDGTIEGWFIPRYTQEANPEIVSAETAIAHPEVFPDPEDSSKGRLYSCPPGWGCELATSALFKAYDMSDAWNLFSPGSGGALDASIARAFTREEPILFYYWGPTAILGKYDAVALDMGESKPEVYACNTNPDCTDEPGVTAYPSSPAIVGAAAWVKEEAPTVADYFSKVGLTNAEISELLVYGDENQADAEATAINFLKTKEDVWTTWVSPEVADKVRASLS